MKPPSVQRNWSDSTDAALQARAVQWTGEMHSLSSTIRTILSVESLIAWVVPLILVAGLLFPPWLVATSKTTYGVVESDAGFGAWWDRPVVWHYAAGNYEVQRQMPVHLDGMRWVVQLVALLLGWLIVRIVLGRWLRHLVARFNALEAG